VYGTGLPQPLEAAHQALAMNENFRDETRASPAGGTATSPLRQALVFLGLGAITFAAAAIGSAVTATSVDGWYRTLHKPAWNPPGWVFGPVWAILYCLMAIAAWLVWKKAGWSGARGAMSLYFLQLAFNVGWSVLFFGMQSPGLALVEIAGLWLLIVATIIAFRRHSGAAAWLMVPYLAWTTFAAVLNFALWRMNA
jgi:benzodiazapine receptor